MAKEEERKGPWPANDNGSPSGEPLDPRIRRIAEAIGRQLAREQGKPPAAANDSEPQR
jgi:broad specificity phosphatase PhoE